MRTLADRHGVPRSSRRWSTSRTTAAATWSRRRPRRLARSDVLVNAAGIYPASPLAAMTAAAWDRVQHVNVRAPMLLTVAMAAQATPGGAVVNISSGAATRARPGAAHYCTSKAALEMADRGPAPSSSPTPASV